MFLSVLPVGVINDDTTKVLLILTVSRFIAKPLWKTIMFCRYFFIIFSTFVKQVPIEEEEGIITATT